MEKRELSKIDFEVIDDAFKALLQSSHPDPIFKRVGVWDESN